MGAVTSAKLLASAAFKDGKSCQAFPFFGVDRRGSPVEAYCRIDDSFILVRQQVYTPDYVMILDKTLIGVVDVLAGLKEGGVIIVNSDVSVDFKSDAKVFRVDATKIAFDIFGKNLVNTPILGAFVKATGQVTFKSLIAAIKEHFKGDIADKNVEAVKRAYKECR